MNTSKHETPRIQAHDLGRRLVHGIAHSARAVAAVVAECHRAQRDLAVLRLQPDRYALEGDAAPDSYAEFLFRSPDTVWHEPSARERAATAGRCR
jgi:hypothetical protein